MSRGKTEDEAFMEAVGSLDGLEELTEELSGKRRRLYVNRLYFRHCLLVCAVVALEVLAWLAASWAGATGGMKPGILDLGVLVLAAVAFCPIVSGIICKKNPDKAERVEFDFRRCITIALFGWLALSLGLAIFNVATLANMPVGVVWFHLPVIGISNWPVSILFYNILYKSKRYEAK